MNNKLTDNNQAIPKIIPRQVHAAADYGYAALFSAGPEIVGFTDEETAALLSRIVGGKVLLTSLLTRYELGVIRVLPFKAHLAADVVLGLLTLSAPFMFGFSRNKKARNFFVGMGAFSVMAGLLTDPKEMDEKA
jgi:hypothetical protein